MGRFPPFALALVLVLLLLLLSEAWAMRLLSSERFLPTGR